MEIVDAQMHVWGEEAPNPPGLPRRTPLGAEEVVAAMDAAGVARAVLVPPLFSYAMAGNSVALAAARRFPDRFVVVGQLDPIRDVGTDLSVWLEPPGMVGLHLVLRPPVRPADAEWVFRAAEEHDIPLMVIFSPHAPLAAAEIAARYRGVRLIVDHFGLPSEAGLDDLEEHFSELSVLAGHDNVALKLSALLTKAREPYPFSRLMRHVGRAVDLFGASRCLWGSDLMVHLGGLQTTYRQWVEVFLGDGLNLSPGERAEILGGSVTRWLAPPGRQ